MGDNWKNGSHLEKRGSHLKKKSQTWKCRLHFVQWATLGRKRISPQKIGHTLKTGSHLKKWVILEKLSHTWKKGRTWKIESYLGKWVFLGHK